MRLKLLGVIMLIAMHLNGDQPFFFVIIPTYHNRAWCIKNLEALVQQTYTNWHAYIIVDGSWDEDDGTGKLLQEYILGRQLGDKITFVHNHERKLALANIYDAIHDACGDDWIVVLYDGDDWFYCNEVLARVAKEYRDGTTWLTYGQYVDFPKMNRGCCAPLPIHVMRERTFRSYRWVTSHLRTFKAWLFKKIRREDLLYHGQFYPVAWDLAFMFPMLEMASRGHIRFISDVLYVYNHHDCNDYRKNLALQTCLDKYLRTLPSYKPL